MLFRSAKCLIAWAQVCRPKAESGLGIRCLSTQNTCLQVKLLHRLHSSPDSPWASWAWKDVDGPVAAGKRSSSGPHWKALAALMPLYRDISTPTVGDGERTSFWLDDWLGGGALCNRVQALFSHATKPHASVATVLRRGITASLVPRLTAVAENELAMILPAINEVSLSQLPDTRSLVRCRKKAGRWTSEHSTGCRGSAEWTPFL